MSPSSETRKGSRKGRQNDPGRRDRIIDACLEVISTRGVTGATHRAIAGVAEVPLGSMTYYFSSLDALRHEAFTLFANKSVEKLEQRMARSTDIKSAKEALEAFVEEDVFKVSRDLVLTHELYTLAARDPSYREITSSWMTRSRNALEQHFDPETARILDALVEGLTIHRALDIKSHGTQEVISAINRVI